MSKDEPLRGDRIKTALGRLDLLGTALTQAIIMYLEDRGNTLDDKHFYTHNEIETELAAVFGIEAANLIGKQIRRIYNDP